MARDCIRLQGMIFYAFHGVNEAERELGQRYEVDLSIEADLSLAAKTDNLMDTVNYAQVYRVVKEILEGPSRNLIESLGYSVARKILDDFPLVESVCVEIAKPGAAIKGSILKRASIVVEQRRNEC